MTYIFVKCEKCGREMEVDVFKISSEPCIICGVCRNGGNQINDGKKTKK